jgi:hypothetical protein
LRWARLVVVVVVVVVLLLTVPIVFSPTPSPHLQLPPILESDPQIRNASRTTSTVTVRTTVSSKMNAKAITTNKPIWHANRPATRSHAVYTVVKVAVLLVRIAFAPPSLARR